MSDFREAYKKVRPSIVGIGISSDTHHEILGTGFIFEKRNSIFSILTNLHNVASQIRPTGQWELETDDNVSLFFFPQTLSPQDSPITAVPLRHCIRGFERDFSPIGRPLKTGAEPLDICIISVDSRKLPACLAPAQIAGSAGATEGLEIAMIGLPCSPPLDQLSQPLTIVTPVLQVGRIAARIFFAGAAIEENFLLDLSVNVGSSGSPLFIQDGSVIGIVTQSRLRREELVNVRGEPDKGPGEFRFVEKMIPIGIAIPSIQFFDNANLLKGKVIVGARI